MFVAFEHALTELTRSACKLTAFIIRSSLSFLTSFELVVQFHDNTTIIA